MARILHKNSTVKEIYLADGNIENSKYIMLVFEDGYIGLEWCYEDIIEIQPNPCLTKVGRKMILEYGEPNLFQQKQRLPFQDEQGNLEQIWEKIK